MKLAIFTIHNPYIEATPTPKVNIAIIHSPASPNKSIIPLYITPNVTSVSPFIVIGAKNTKIAIKVAIKDTVTPFLWFSLLISNESITGRSSRSKPRL